MVIFESNQPLAKLWGGDFQYCILITIHILEQVLSTRCPTLQTLYMSYKFSPDKHWRTLYRHSSWARHGGRREGLTQQRVMKTYYTFHAATMSCCLPARKESPSTKNKGTNTQALLEGHYEFLRTSTAFTPQLVLMKYSPTHCLIKKRLRIYESKIHT